MSCAGNDSVLSPLFVPIFGLKCMYSLYTKLACGFAVICNFLCLLYMQENPEPALDMHLCLPVQDSIYECDVSMQQIEEVNCAVLLQAAFAEVHVYRPPTTHLQIKKKISTERCSSPV